MAKRNKIQISAPGDLEVHPTVAGFEIALRKADRDGDRQYFEIVLRSLDHTSSEQLLLTDNKRLATRQLMAFHAGACAMQHIHGVPLDTRLA